MGAHRCEQERTLAVLWDLIKSHFGLVLLPSKGPILFSAFKTQGGPKGTGPPLPGSAIPAVHHVHRLFRSKFRIV